MNYTVNDMPSYTRNEDFDYKMYMTKQDLLNMKLSQGQPVQMTQAGGSMDSQPNTWMPQGK